MKELQKLIELVDRDDNLLGLKIGINQVSPEDRLRIRSIYPFNIDGHFFVYTKFQE